MEKSIWQMPKFTDPINNIWSLWMSVITASKHLRLLQKTIKSLFSTIYIFCFFTWIFFSRNVCYFFKLYFCLSYPGLLYVVMLFLEIYSVWDQIWSCTQKPKQMSIFRLFKFHFLYFTILFLLCHMEVNLYHGVKIRFLCNQIFSSDFLKLDT